MSRRVRIGLVVGLAALAAGCAKDAQQDTWDPAGENAQMIHDLQWPVFAIAGVVMLIVFAAVLFIVIRFRDRGQEMPEQTHGKPALEIALTILPALILIGIAIPSVTTLMALNKSDDTECIINVTGQQWWWEMDYPVQDGCGGISEPIVTSGQLVMPADTNVLVRLTSRDVIHSWWIPRLNGKRDVVPGRVHLNRLQADEPGIYYGQCAEFCGLSHANMRMEVVALDDGDFESWKTKQTSDYVAPEAGTLAAAGESTFIAQCSRCHQVNGIEDGNGDPVIARPDLNVYSGAAPNLSWFMTRNTFAGASFDLLNAQCRSNVWDAPSDEVGEKYLAGISPDCLNSVQLREWLRDAPAMKPMYTEPEQLEPTDGLTRGMPNLALSEDQIDEIVAYLLERQ
jgi:cytochrome c oxidase subunit 2